MLKTGRDTTIAPYASGGDGESVVDIEALLRTIWRGKWIIGITTALGVALGVLVLMSIPPYYTATTTLIFYPERGEVLDLPTLNPNADPAQTPAAVSTEIQILTSTPLLTRVVDTLGLRDDPAFNPFLPQPEPTWSTNPLGRLSALIDQGLAAIPFLAEAAPPEMTPEEREALVTRLIVNRLKVSLAVTQVGLSQAVAVVSTQASAGKAARVANAVAEAYIELQRSEKFEASRRTANWLSNRMTDLETQMQTSENRAERYRAENGLATSVDPAAPSRASQLAQQRVLLRQGLDQARQRQAVLEQRLEAARSGATDTAEAVIQDTVRELEAASSRIAALEESGAELDARISEITEAEAVLAQLERQAAADRFIYERFLQQMKEIDALGTFNRADARIIEPAVLPFRPSGPSKKLILVIALVMGGVIGFGLVGLRELLRRGINYREELERVTGLPLVASIPRVRGGSSWRNVLRHMERYPNSDLAAAVRLMRAAIGNAHTSDGKGSTAVVITSAVPNEGKSVLSMALAKSSIASGKRAVILDCDFRRSRFASALQLNGKVGLADVLKGTMALKDAVQVSKRFDLHVIPAGQASSGHPEAFFDDTISDVIETLKHEYDLIVIDTPPLRPVVDAGLVARYADVILYVVGWGVTDRSLVAEGLRTLRSFDVEPTGTVFNFTNLRKESHYRSIPYHRYDQYSARG